MSGWLATAGDAVGAAAAHGADVAPVQAGEQGLRILAGAAGPEQSAMRRQKQSGQDDGQANDRATLKTIREVAPVKICDELETKVHDPTETVNNLRVITCVLRYVVTTQ